METRFLESFIVFTECRSLVEASRKLSLTPAALSLRFKALEDEVGYPLLSRVGRIVRPTAAGLRLAEQSRGVIQGIRDLRTLGDGPELEGELRLGVASSGVAGVLCNLLLDIADMYPKLELIITKGNSSSLYGSLLEDRIDAALMFQPLFEVPKGLDWSAIHSERYIVIAPGSFGGRNALDLLGSEPFIRYDHRLWSGQIASRYLDSKGIVPRERLELDGLEAIAVLVSRGLGVSLVPDWSTPWPEGLDLSKLELPDDRPMRTMGMMWPRASRRLPLVHALIAMATRPRETSGGDV